MTDTGVVVLVIIAVAAAVPGAVTVYVLRRQQRAIRAQIEAQVQARLEAQEAALRAQFEAQIEAQIEALVRMIEAQQKVNLFLTGRLDEMERSRAEEYAETEILRQETDDLRHEVRDLRNGVAALTRQIEALGATPSWLPAVRAPAETQAARQDARSLMEFIEGHFNLAEMADLADQLGLDIENVAGDDKEARARELVNYMKRRKRLKELREVVRSLRPGGEV